MTTQAASLHGVASSSLEALLTGLQDTIQRILAANNPIGLAIADSDVANLYLAIAHLMMAGVCGFYIFRRWRRSHVLMPAVLFTFFVTRAVALFSMLIPNSHPDQALSLLIHGITSEAALAIAFAALLSIHFIVQRPGRAELFESNELLKSEVASRLAVEKKLSAAMAGLETRVAERTAELEKTNAALTAEISERTATAIALKAAKDRAEASNRAKNEFLANMSHEIRTPMTAIVGFSDMLTERDSTKAERITYIESIKRNGDILLKIIDDILDLAKIESGAIHVDRALTSVAAIIREIGVMFEASAAERGLTVSFKADNALPEFIFSDQIRIRQILINLIGNALKFTDRGGIQVSLRYGDQKLFFQVKDTGCGIKSEHTRKIFQPFVQADTSVTKRYGGTGLGLALSRRLAVSLGGDLVLSNSTVGGGSTFEFHCATGDVSQSKMITDFTLPADPTGEIDSRAKTNEPIIDLKGLTILLAEDSPDLQVLTTRILSERGAAVVLAQNGLEAVKKANAAPIDIVLMDIQMPEMDGLTAAKKLRAEGFGKPLIAMTAYAMEGDRERCLDAGFTDYISKPIRRNHLLKLIDEYRKGISSSEAGLPQSEYADDPVIGPVLHLFTNSLPERTIALEQAIKENSRERVQRLAHQLRGSAGAFGFSSITAVAGKVEEAAVNGSEWAKVVEFAENLFELLATIKPRPSKPPGETPSPTTYRSGNEENTQWLS